MSTADVIIFPTVPVVKCESKPAPRGEWQGVAIRLEGDDLAKLKQVSEYLGISLDDAANRIVRIGLKTWCPGFRPDDGGAA